MLIITRKIGQSIMVGDKIKITLVRTRSGDARIGIDCPRDVPVDRLEIFEEIQKLGYDRRRDGRKPGK